MSIINRRRTIRRFEEKAVEDNKIENILRAAMQAPSAFGYQPWEFIVIKKTETSKKILNINEHARGIKNANVLIVVLANLNTVKNNSEWWIQDCSASIQNMLLQCVEEGLGSAWLGYYPQKDRVDGLIELFDLPQNIIPFGVVAIGYNENKNIYFDKFDREKVFVEEYKKDKIYDEELSC